MFRHVTESKWNLKPFFKPKLKPNFSQLNCHPVQGDAKKKVCVLIFHLWCCQATWPVDAQPISQRLVLGCVSSPRWQDAGSRNLGQPFLRISNYSCYNPRISEIGMAKYPGSTEAGNFKHAGKLFQISVNTDLESSESRELLAAIHAT